ncbi:MAG TPA: hypothetical protein VGR96_18690 [Acidobacteriaceae bacterium]|nr:hypothetical protein [Acidobacteriaceae bacterium]
MGFGRSLVRVALSGVIVCFSPTIFAAPATFVTALPVAQNQALVRFNVQPALGNSGYRSLQFPVNVGYGVTPSWALFVNINEGYVHLDHNQASGGTGDLLIFLRNTLYKVDKPKSTFRVAPLVGVSLPTGGNQRMMNGAIAPGELQTGSGTFDPYAGITSGYNTPRYGAALDATWRYNPIANSGYSPGTQLRADGQVEFTLLPLHLPDEGLPNLLLLSLEANYAQNADAHIDRVRSESANKIFSQDAIFEIASLHWEAGAGAQFPVMEDFMSPAAVKEHVGFYAFFEYYLSTPGWRHRKRKE